MNGIAIRTRSVSEAVADALSGLSAKLVAERLRTNQRTVENWKQQKATPQAKHVAAILNDDMLCGPFLREMGRPDLAQQHEISTLERRLDALKQAGERHKAETHEIRESLDAGRARDPVGGGRSERVHDGLPASGGVVPGQSEE